MDRKLRAGRALLAAVTIGLLSLPALAGPIVSMGGYWGPFFYDTDVVCGQASRCDTDQFQYASYERYDLLGADGVVRQARSGPAYSALSILGVGTEVSTDNAYQYQLTVARTLFASVQAGAPSAAFARAQANLTGLFGFELSETVRYSGSSFNLLDYGALSDGAILAPGRYEGFFGQVFTRDFTTAVVHAGQHDFRSDIGTFRFRVESVAVPEPATLALFGVGVLGMLIARKRRTLATARA